MIYALADRGVRLLRDWDGAEFRNPEWSRKNREAGRPFIEHQIATVDFAVGLQRAVRTHGGIELVTAEEMIAAAPGRLPATHPFSLHARLSDRGVVREAAIIPDIVFALELADGSRRNFMVEIDRGTMPVRRTDPEQTSIERKMRVYLAAHSGKQHRKQFGWANFRVLVVTTDEHRVGSMIDAVPRLRVSRGVGPALFLFTTFDTLRGADPLQCEWLDGNRQTVSLI